MTGLMGFFCKVECIKCGAIDNDFTDSEVTSFTVSFGKENKPHCNAEKETYSEGYNCDNCEHEDCVNSE
jgi:hypothetical protein